jgi:hypothetical protein
MYLPTHGMHVAFATVSELWYLPALQMLHALVIETNSFPAVQALQPPGESCSVSVWPSSRMYFPTQSSHLMDGFKWAMDW